MFHLKQNFHAWMWVHIYEIKVIVSTVIASGNFKSIIKIESWFPALL